MNPMDRNRPYTGQEHTYLGERGKTEVKGLTMRDVHDCVMRAFFLSAFHVVPELYQEATKGERADLNHGDLFGWDLNEVDPVALLQNATCEIEKMMGIFPNVNGLEESNNGE